MNARGATSVVLGDLCGDSRGLDSPTVSAQDPPTTLRLVDIAHLLNATQERARQLADDDRCGFPAPVATSRRRAWGREEVGA
jgi:hypothetical protein